MNVKLLFSSTALALLMGSTTPGIFAASNSTATGMDSQFATKAAAGGMAEVELGKLALKNASSADVKTFAQRMVDDHSKANEKLKSVAAKDSMNLPSDMDAKEKANYDRLAKLQGAAFDRAYMKDMVKDHKTDVAEFQKEANNGKNAQLKAFASDTLPTLQEHLRMAEDTNTKLK